MSLRFIAFACYTPIAIGVALWRPLWGLYALFIMYYFRPGVWGVPEWFTPVNWITIACIIGWAIHARDIRTNRSLVLASLLLISMCFSSLMAWRSPDVSWTATVTVTKLVTVMFLIVQLIRNLTQLNQFLWVNIIGNLWTTKSVVWSSLTGGTYRVDVGAGQGGGANYLAMIFAMGIPLFFFKYLHGSRRERLASVIIAPFYLASIVGTGSRGGFLTIGVVFMYLLAMSKRKIVGTFAIVVMGIVFIVVTPQEKWDRFMTTFAPKEERGFAAESRIMLWTAGLEMFSDSPLAGVGHRNFQLLSPRYVGFFGGMTPKPYDASKEGLVGYTGFVAHNTWIQSLADGGIIGSVPFFGLFIVSFWICRRSRMLAIPPPWNVEVHVMSRVFEGIFVAFCVASTFSSHMEIDFLWWYFGAVSVFGTIAQDMSDRYLAAVNRARREVFQRQQAQARTVDV